jgi:hypothetical protein
MVILRTEPFKYILTMYLPDGLSTGTPLRCGKMLREMSVRPKRRSHAAHTANEDTNVHGPCCCVIPTCEISLMTTGYSPKICAGRPHATPCDFCSLEKRSCPWSSL